MNLQELQLTDSVNLASFKNDSKHVFLQDKNVKDTFAFEYSLQQLVDFMNEFSKKVGLVSWKSNNYNYSIASKYKDNQYEFKLVSEDSTNYKKTRTLNLTEFQFGQFLKFLTSFN